MSAIIYVFDPERRSREPDACPERDPAGATIVVLPVARGDHCGPPCDVAVTLDEEERVEVGFYDSCGRWWGVAT